VPTTTRKPTAIRRDEIAQAVVSIIGAHGITALTTSRLATEVGLTSGALFRHFASQDDILRYATRRVVARLEATFPDVALPPAERIAALAAARVRLLGSDPGVAWFVHSEQSRLVLPADAALHLRGLVDRTKAFLLAAIREGAAEGTLRDDIDPNVLLVPVLGTIHALIGTSGPLRAGALRRLRPEAVLDGLMRLLAPPSTTRRARSADRATREENA
jgi:AcrR family transcriptional regulator